MMFMNGQCSIQTQSWLMQIYWPYVRTGAYGLQIFADTSMRIHPAKSAYALMVLGFGMGIIESVPENIKEDL